MRATLAAGLAAMLLLSAPPAAAQGSARATITVRGSVADAGSGAPIGGATVVVRSLRTSAVSDSTGQFTIQVPAGAHVFTFERLGYARLREEIDIVEGDRLDVGLLPRPVLLEVLTVSANKLAERRSRVPISSFAMTHEQIAMAGYSNAAQAAMLRFNFESCPGARSDACVLVRGRRQGLVVYINEARAHGGVEQLRGIPPGDLYLLEWYPSNTTLRAYTVAYMEAVAVGKRTLRTLDQVDW
jgi:hypothetical protein